MADEFQKIRPRIIDRDLMQDDAPGQFVGAQPLQPQQPPQAPQSTDTGNWFTNMSLNKKIAICIIFAIGVIFLLVLVVRYYNSQPQQPPPQPSQQQPPPQPSQQPQQQAQQQSQQQTPQQSPQQTPQQSQQPQQQVPQQVQQQHVNAPNQSISKEEALEALKAAANSQHAPETVVGRPINDISQIMNNDYQQTQPPSQEQPNDLLNGFMDVNTKIECDNSSVQNPDENVEVVSEGSSDQCISFTSTGKQCRNKAKNDGKCHIHQ